MRQGYRQKYSGDDEDDDDAPRAKVKGILNARLNVNLLLAKILTSKGELSNYQPHK
jgi:hypothetical protein